MRLTEQIEVIEKGRSGRTGENHTKIIGAKIVLEGTDEFKKNLEGIRCEIEKYSDSLRVATQNMEQLEKSRKEFGGLNIDTELLVQTLTQDLKRREINNRIAVALLGFVEKVSAGKSSSSSGRDKYVVARDKEIEVLPEVVELLLKVSQRLPG